MFKFSIPEIVVRLVPHEEVLTLREEVKKAHEELDALRLEYNRTEYRFRCESVVNNRLIDFCRENGLRVDPSILRWADDQAV